MGQKAPPPTKATASARLVPEARLPVELLCLTAHFLSYSDACAAVNVSHRWRQALLADTSLWTHVRVVLMSSGHGRWLSTMRTLIKRSAGRPFTLELATEDRVQELYGPKYLALEGVAFYLVEHMQNLEVLNLSIPTCATPCWDLFLRMKAPLLRSFRLYNMTYYDSEPPLPSRLFGGHAPLLETLCLEQAFLRLELIGSAALKNVTSLYYHNSHNGLHERDMFKYLGDFMPKLTQLTCTVLENYGDDLFVYPHPIDLRLLVKPRVSAMAARFPRATSVTYSYYSQHLRTGGLIAIVEEAVRTQLPATSVDIALAPGPRGMPYWLGSHKPEEHHAIFVNGRALVVDIHIDTLCAALMMTPGLIGLLTEHVRTLSVVATVWPAFAFAAMPALEELTLYVTIDILDRILHQKWPAPRFALRTLRFALAERNSAEYYVSANHIASLVENIVAAGCLPTLYLTGIRTTSDRHAALAGITKRTVYEPLSPIEELEQWSWELREEDAFSCR